MSRLLFAVCGLSVASLATSAASAQSFGEQGQFAVTGGPLLRIAYTRTKVTLETPGGDTEVKRSVTDVELLGTQSARLGFHYLPIDHLSVGASFVFRSQTGEDETDGPTGPTRTTDIPEETAFELGASVGYVMMFTDLLGIWPQVGIGYASFKEENAANVTKASAPTVGVGVPLVIQPVEHFAFSVGPDIGFLFAGSAEVRDKSSGTTTDGSYSGFSVGLGAGLIGYF